MANNLGEDLTNRVVIIGAEHLKPKYAESYLRAFRVLDGFGAVPYTSGSAILGEVLSSGVKCRMEGWQVERYATEEEIALAESVRGGCADTRASEARTCAFGFEGGICGLRAAHEGPHQEAN
jgi:hypothetical protein